MTGCPSEAASNWHLACEKKQEDGTRRDVQAPSIPLLNLGRRCSSRAPVSSHLARESKRNETKHDILRSRATFTALGKRSETKRNETKHGTRKKWRGHLQTLDARVVAEVRAVREPLRADDDLGFPRHAATNKTERGKNGRISLQ